MNEKISMFNAELNAINIVLNKLVTKQNSSVFDKLCIKCNNLLNNIDLAIPEIKTVEEKNSMLSVLRGLREAASKLSVYREYLIASINAKMETIQNNVISLENDYTKKLVLENKNQKDAA